MVTKIEYNDNKVTCSISTCVTIDKTPSSLKTYEKVAKYVLYFFTAGLAYIAYQGYKLAGKSFYAIFPGEKIEGDGPISHYKVIGLNSLNAAGITEVANNKKHLLNTDQKGKQFIPLVIKGIFRDHITFLGIDYENNKIIFYDPKGYTLKDYEHCKIANYAEVGFSKNMTNITEFTKKNVAELVNGLFEIFVNQKDWELVQNAREYQKDSYNCGVHFYNAVREFKKDSENVFTNVLETRSDITQTRVEMDAMASVYVESCLSKNWESDSE